MPAELRAFLRIVLAATLASVIVAILITTMVGHISDLWPIPFAATWFDYYAFFDSMSLLHTAEFFTKPAYPFTYMPSGILLYKFLYLFGKTGGLLVYAALLLSGVIWGALRMNALMVRGGVPKRQADNFLVAVALTSYPIFFCLQRGNLEILLAIGIAVGVWAYWTGRYYFAAIIWGLCGSVKLYPLLLLAIFLSRRQYRQLFTGIAAALLITLASLTYMGPTFSIALLGMRHGVQIFVSRYALHYDAWIGYDHSLFALIKVGLKPWHPSLPNLLAFYTPIAGSSALILYLARVRKLPFPNQLLFLTAMSILLPPTAFDYSLLQMYAPFAVFTLLALERSSAGLTAIFIAFGLLFAPTQFAIANSHIYTGQFKALMLLALAGLACRFPGIPHNGATHPATKHQLLRMNSTQSDSPRPSG